MKRQIIILGVLLALALPLAAQTCPDELVGEKYKDWGSLELWVTPEELRNAPWSMATPPDPANMGYTALFTFDLEGVEVSMGPMMTRFHRVFAPPPAGYLEPVYFEYMEECGAYMKWDEQGARVVFEAWIFRDGGGKSQWISGCLKSTGSIGPWFDEDTSCLWVVYDIEGIPPEPTHMVGGRRARPNGP